MNAVKMLCGKLNLIAGYCDDGLAEKATGGMGDINSALTEAIGALVTYKASHPASRADEAAVIGSLQLALDAMEKQDTAMLAGAVREGLIPEFEKALREGAFEGLEAAGTEAAELPDIDTAGPAVVVCLFGYGDGIFYNSLLNILPEGSDCIVFEPETDSIVDLAATLTETIDFYRLDRTVVCATPGYDTIYRTEYAAFVRAVNQNRERVLVNRNTLRRFRDTASANVITNLHILDHCNLVNDLAAILPGDIPVIIVSAGPSLDKNIEMLKKAKGRSLIFAVDTAMKYLMQHDIMPDLAITVEPIKPMANYEDDRCFDVPHVFDCESNPDIVSRERGRCFIVNCRDYVKRLLEAVGIEVSGECASGGSVATAAFAICYLLQTKTVILVGQDLAYSGTATHAGGVESAGINNDIGTDMVDGVDGSPVRTRSDWMGYLRWFENSIRTINEQKLDMVIVDATEGGAFIHGSRVSTLEDAIEKYCTKPYDFAEALTHLPYMLDDDEAVLLHEKIAQSFAELDEVIAAAQDASALCDRCLAGRETDMTAVQRSLNGYRRTCENALLYPLINNYAVSDIADEVNRLLGEADDGYSAVRQQKLAFDAIRGAGEYFKGLEKK